MRRAKKSAAEASALVGRIGRNTRDVRDGRGWTQGELASRANISLAMISMVERGLRAISLPKLEQLALGLGVDVERLVRRPL